MAEDPEEDKPTKGTGRYGRREFLRKAAAGIAGTLGAGIPNWVPGTVESVARQEAVPVNPLVQEVENMPLPELEHLVYEACPVVPDISPIAPRINAIAQVPEHSNLMIAGTSVGDGMGMNIFGGNIADFGTEPQKLQEVLGHFQIPSGAAGFALVAAMDVPSLFDSMLCTSPLCQPNEGLVDAYIRSYGPKVAVNFVGTNLIRFGLDLDSFRSDIESLVDNYVAKGVIPVLTTLPHPRNENEEPYYSWYNNPVVPTDSNLLQGRSPEEWVQEQVAQRRAFLPENALKYNALLIKIAENRQIPIINLQRGVVESAVNNGNPTVADGVPEVDPLHFLVTASGFSVPQAGTKFSSGEQAVSYFMVKTLYEILEHQGG